eukprot:gene16059-21291_t
MPFVVFEVARHSTARAPVLGGGPVKQVKPPKPPRERKIWTEEEKLAARMAAKRIARPKPPAGPRKAATPCSRCLLFAPALMVERGLNFTRRRPHTSRRRPIAPLFAGLIPASAR